MPRTTYEVATRDRKVTRTAEAIGGIAIVKCFNRTYRDAYCWQLDHVPTGRSMAMVSTKQQAQRLRRDLLALADWNAIDSEGIGKDLRIRASVAIQRYPVPPFAKGRYFPEDML